MFEEFGKKLDGDQQTEWSIQQLRDPIYASTYSSVEKAIEQNQPIAGSMFWKLAIPVFDGQDARGKFVAHRNNSICPALHLHCRTL